MCVNVFCLKGIKTCDTWVLLLYVSNSNPFGYPHVHIHVFVERNESYKVLILPNS